DPAPQKPLVDSKCVLGGVRTRDQGDVRVECRVVRRLVVLDDDSEVAAESRYATEVLTDLRPGAIQCRDDRPASLVDQLGELLGDEPGSVQHNLWLPAHEPRVADSAKSVYKRQCCSGVPVQSPSILRPWPP